MEVNTFVGLDHTVRRMAVLSQFSNPQENDAQDLSLPTAVDLSASQYCFVYLVSGLIVLAASGSMPIGVLQNAPKGTAANHAAAQVRIFGTSKLKMGAGVSSAKDVASTPNIPTGENTYNASVSITYEIR